MSEASAHEASVDASAVAAGQAPIGVAILGSTGSIGQSALRVLGRHRDRFRVAALTANASRDALAAQVAEWHPSFVGLVTDAVPARPEASGDAWHCGAECLVHAVVRDDVQIVINAVVGAAGLPATLAALRAGKRVALANKETLVMAGDIVTATAIAHGGELVPVDSEHSAILQCLAGRQPHEVRRLVLTASGGPFRTWSAARIAEATVADALKHPTWSMGSKITIDSATLANKALEVIEAHHLFGVPYDRIEVVVHPQSVIHSFVEFIDGSVLAQLGVPSMELPILYALTWPERVTDHGVPQFDPVALGSLTFEAVRADQFPMLALGVAAGRTGGSAPAVFNAANEAAVAHFLAGRVRFGDIPVLVSGALEAARSVASEAGTDRLAALIAADRAARDHVDESVRQRANTASKVTQ